MVICSLPKNQGLFLLLDQSRKSKSRALPRKLQSSLATATFFSCFRLIIASQKFPMSIYKIPTKPTTQVIEYFNSFSFSFIATHWLLSHTHPLDNRSSVHGGTQAFHLALCYPSCYYGCYSYCTRERTCSFASHDKWVGPWSASFGCPCIDLFDAIPCPPSPMMSTQEDKDI